MATPLVLCNVSVASLPLREVIGAAAAAGFTGISVLGRSRRRAARAGVDDLALRALAEAAGVPILDVEAAGDWLGAAPDGPAWLDAVYGWEDYVDIAAALGATTVVAVHFGPAAPLPRAADAFGRLCDRAAGHGLRVALEFPAWATIGDVASAWAVVRAAGRANGGLVVDNWHHRRGANDDDALRAVPAERIFSVQLSDAAARPVGPPEVDVLQRRLPGRGDLDPAGFLRGLWDRGVDAPVGVEVYDAELVAQGAGPAAITLYDALRRTVEAARS